MWKTVFDFYSASPPIPTWHFRQGLQTCKNMNTLKICQKTSRIFSYGRNSKLEVDMNFEYIFRSYQPLWTWGRSKMAEVHGELDVIKFLLHKQILLKINSNLVKCCHHAQKQKSALLKKRILNIFFIVRHCHFFPSSE